MTDQPALTPTSAIHLALNLAGPHEVSGYRAVVTEAQHPFVELRLLREIGLAERSHSTQVRRDQSAVQFEAQCQQAWAYLLAQHRRSKEATGI